ncbi:MAG: hypothetical protein H7Z18_05115 [Methylophilaceae bacterium]|nr:hypothetical protein [Methylophilaceae bacterium]
MKVVQKLMLSMLLLARVNSTANASTVTYDYVGSDFNAFVILNPSTRSLEISNTLPSTIGPRITGSATFADGIDNPVLSDGFKTLGSIVSIRPVPY